MDKADPLTEFCRQNLDRCERNATALKSGRLRVGKSYDGTTWIDTTAEQIAVVDNQIADLKRFLESTDA